MIERFLKGEGQELEFNVPEHFNFAYDVVDAWAEEAPDKLALLWTSATESERRYTFAELKRESDKVAGYLSSLGIGRGDFVMLILKRRLFILQYLAVGCNSLASLLKRLYAPALRDSPFAVQHFLSSIIYRGELALPSMGR